MSAPMDGGAGAMSSSCPKDCIAGISTGVTTSAMTAISSRDSLEFITDDSLIMIKRIFPDYVQFLSTFI
jgi:hypothetical protein